MDRVLGILLGTSKVNVLVYGTQSELCHLSHKVISAEFQDPMYMAYRISTNFNVPFSHYKLNYT